MPTFQILLSSLAMTTMVFVQPAVAAALSPAETVKETIAMVMNILNDTPLRLLETCRALRGDRIAAGEVYRQLVESGFPGEIADPRMFASSRRDF